MFNLLPLAFFFLHVLHVFSPFSPCMEDAAVPPVILTNHRACFPPPPLTSTFARGMTCQCAGRSTFRAFGSSGREFFVNLGDLFAPTEIPSPSRSGMNQPADGGFGGPGTPQSPLLSPRMAHAQSPMMQQGQGGAAFQGSPEMNGWPQGGMGGNR